MKSQPLGPYRAAGYGIGDFGFNLFYTGLNLYLLFYYTDVIGIAPGLAALIFILPVIWDAVIDPFVGLVASRNRSRWGTYRPFLLLGAPVVAASFVMIFAAPLIWQNHIVLACLVSHIVFRTAYAVVNIPYSSLSAALTQDARARSWLATARMQFSTLGGVTAAFGTPALANMLGDGDLKSGYLWTAVLFAIAAALVVWICFATTRETSGGVERRPHTVLQTWRFLRLNHAFWILAAAILLAIFGISVSNKSLVYYTAYYAGLPDSTGLVLGVSTLMTGLSVAGWTYFGSKRSKRRIWMVGSAGSVMIQLLLFIAAPTSLPMILLLVGMNGACLGAIIVMLWSMLPDTVEFGQWASGVRDESIVFGLNNLVQKVSSALGASFVGAMLALLGYVPDTLQSGETLFGLRMIAFLIPAAAFLLAALIIRYYPMGPTDHNRIVAHLRQTSGPHGRGMS